MTGSFADTFGVLRSLFDSDDIYTEDIESWKRRLLVHLSRAHAESEERYEAQIVPYLRDKLASRSVEFVAHPKAQPLSLLARLLPRNARIKANPYAISRNDLNHFLARPDLNRITHLEFGGVLNADELRELFDAGRFADLHKLSLEDVNASALSKKTLETFPRVKALSTRGVALTARVLEAMAWAGCFDQIEALSLHYPELKTKDLPVFFGSKMLSELRHLELQVNNDKCLVMLAAAQPVLSSLETLRVSSNSMRKGHSALLSSSLPEGLREFRLCDYMWGNHAPKTDAIKVFASRPAGLERIDLQYLRLDDKGAAILAEGDVFGACASLRLAESEDSPLSARAISSLVQSKSLARLEHLDLFSPLRTAEEIDALTRDVSFQKNLRTLTLFLNGMDTADFVDLVERLGRFEALRALSIRHEGVPIGKAGIQALLESPVMAHLEGLRLLDFKLDEEIMKIMACSDRLGSLRKLELGGRRIKRADGDVLSTSQKLAHIEELVVRGEYIRPDLVMAT